MKAKILQLVNQRHDASDGKCGTYMVEIVNRLGIPAKELEAVIAEMYNAGEIDVREGINGYLVMKIEAHDIHNIPKQAGAPDDPLHPVPGILRE